MENEPDLMMDENQMASGSKKRKKGGRGRDYQSSAMGYGSGEGESGGSSGMLDQGRRMAGEWAEGIGRAMPSTRALEPLTSNPVVLGALGLGLGVVIGAMLPRQAVQSGMDMVGLSGLTGGSQRSRSGESGSSGSSGGGSGRSGGARKKGRKSS